MTLSYRVLLSEEAISDFQDAYFWYELQRDNLGHEFELSVEATLNRIARDPFAQEEKYRKVRVAYTQRFPYGIHYLVEDKSVKVQSIFHTSRYPNK